MGDDYGKFGGASVPLHFMSQLSEGLFYNGFSHSGTALNSWVIVKSPREKGHQVASFINCSQESTLR